MPFTLQQNLICRRGSAILSILLAHKLGPCPRPQQLWTKPHTAARARMQTFWVDTFLPSAAEVNSGLSVTTFVE
jgi:hypothetical protein